jgi:hypothetical protein
MYARENMQEVKYDEKIIIQELSLNERESLGRGWCFAGCLEDEVENGSFSERILSHAAQYGTLGRHHVIQETLRFATALVLNISITRYLIVIIGKFQPLHR